MTATTATRFGSLAALISALQVSTSAAFPSDNPPVEGGQEWLEDRILQNGQKARVRYFFSDEETTYDDGSPADPEFYPWDDAHIIGAVVYDGDGDYYRLER